MLTCPQSSTVSDFEVCALCTLNFLDKSLFLGSCMTGLPGPLWADRQLWNLVGTATSTSEDRRDLHPTPESVLCQPSTDVPGAETMFCAVENNLE